MSEHGELLDQLTRESLDPEYIQQIEDLADDISSSALEGNYEGNYEGDYEEDYEGGFKELLGTMEHMGYLHLLDFQGLILDVYEGFDPEDPGDPNDRLKIIDLIL